jgi:hypothetical protein
MKLYNKEVTHPKMSKVGILSGMICKKFSLKNVQKKITLRKIHPTNF